MGLATSDPGSAKAFHTSLFGWDAEDLSAGEAGTYTMLSYGGREVAILYRQQPEARAANAPPHWTSFISVAVRDPTGAIVSLWQPRARVGAALVNDVGALCWNELATTDVGRAKTFFAELLGWEYDTDGGGYVSIENAGSLDGGMREQTGQERGMPPNWLPYFRLRLPTRPRAKPPGWANARYCRPPRPSSGGSRGFPTRSTQRSRSSKARPTHSGTAAFGR